MPITGKTHAEAARVFRDHINQILSKTITQTHVVLVEVPGRELFQASFRQAGEPIKATLNCTFGQIGFYFLQLCGSFIRPKDGLHQLETHVYRYALYPDDSDEPFLRWEYVKKPASQGLWCRHHVQGPIDLQINDSMLSLNAIHLPTGYVTFEEVIRFCIVDLGVQPLDEGWHDLLVKSYEQFKVDFVQRN